MVEEIEHIIRIHDLVQLLLRSQLMTYRERREWLKIAVQTTYQGFEAIGDRRSPQHWSRCSQFASHIESLNRFAEHWDYGNLQLLGVSTWVAVYLDE